ncbi:BatD family protein [Marinomonas sp. 15G1-11]|uniref:BatD family protein n=1 Tax=Marinomonas phaeophyticola TaxID=3004091 RepID=A0ABT4JWS5_9GAMM|nr:BatD family protein [Marinomonas sp. 15G1-11]MCZ2722812.1 BatD family protein [Marinomonas sp. 15G1-11]
MVVIERTHILTSLQFLLSLVKIYVIGLFFLISTGALSATVIASLNKNIVVENEVVQLSIRTDFPDTGSGPDLSSLKRDFDILGQSQNSQFRFNLGTTQALNFWVINLMPKSVGKIEIPKIKVGEYQSESLILEVKNAPQLLDENGNPPVMLKMHSSEPQPYLQQQVILTMALYTSVALQNANISTPNHANLVIERLVDDQSHSEMINGTTYQVRTRQYLAFPQVSGQLDLPPQTISAMINTNAGRRIIKVQSLPISLNILPIPASYSNDYWLPADNVQISSSLTPTTNAHIGDTLTWKIEIRAKGALPEQIPPIAFSSTADYKLYPQPAKFSSQKTSNGIIGNQSLVIEVVPTREGVITLPSIEIPFWNVEDRILEVASTESIDLSILPLVNQSNNQTAIQKSHNENNAIQQENSQPISLAKPKVQPKANTQNIGVELEVTEPSNSSILKILAIASLFAVTLVSVITIWIKKRKKTLLDDEKIPTIKDFAPVTALDEASAYAQLIHCCRANRLSQLRGNLLEWARLRWGDENILGLEDIKRLSNSQEITQLIMESELSMYSDKATSQWNGQALADALEEHISGVPKSSSSDKLKTLYPNF